jgi:hypothetical protein
MREQPSAPAGASSARSSSPAGVSPVRSGREACRVVEDGGEPSRPGAVVSSSGADATGYPRTVMGIRSAAAPLHEHRFERGLVWAGKGDHSGAPASVSSSRAVAPRDRAPLSHK